VHCPFLSPKAVGPNPLTLHGVEAGCDRLRAVDSRAGDGIRTHDVQLGNVARDGQGSKPDKDLRQQAPALTRHLHGKAALDSDLARILDAWPDLPEPIRAAMLAMVASACPAHKAP